MVSRGVAYTLSGILAILVASGGYGMAVKPKLENAKTLEAAIVVETSFRDVMVDYQKRAENVNANFAEITANAAAFNAAFPSASDQSGLLSSLNTAAGSSKAKLLSISPQEPLTLEQITLEAQERSALVPTVDGQAVAAYSDPRYTYMGLDLSLSGNKNQQRDFLKALESLDRKLYVESVTSSTQDSNDGSMKVRLISMITVPLVDPTVAEPPAADTAGGSK